jgi:uncharacterized protein (DUF1330 family)
MSTAIRSPEAGRYHQLVLIWMRDPAKFGRYCEAAAPTVRRYGGDLERMITPDAIYAEGLAKPDVVNVVYYDDRQAFANLGRDPDFQQVVPLRSESIDMATVEGSSVAGSEAPGDVAQRLYLVEVARFGPEGPAGYRRYEEEAEPVMKRFGYHVERVLAPDTASGLPFEPDLVKVAYFDAPDGMERLHGDPLHARIEKELYPAAVRESVWVIGRAHPSPPRHDTR